MGLSDQIKQPGQILGASSGASSGGNFGDLTGFPGDADDIMRGDGSASPLSAAEIFAAIAGVAIDLGTASGTASALTASSADGLAPVSGRLYRLTPGLSNVSSATLEVNGSPTKFIRRPNGAATIAGDILAGVDLLLYYNGTHYRALSGLSIRPGDIPTNNGLAYGYLTLTSDRSSTSTPATVSWDTSVLSGMTISGGNEVTIGETGHYEIALSVMLSSLSPLGVAGYLFLQDWTSGSAVGLATARDAFPGASVAFPRLTWRGPLSSGTKLRVDQQVSSGTGNIDGNRSTWPHNDYFWEIRRVR